MTSNKERKQMLEVAREAIINHHDEKKAPTKKLFNKTGGVFVSVYVDDQLRGCIGEFDSKNLQESIAKNAISAAYQDNRFLAIRKSEYNSFTIHINLLSEPKGMNILDVDDLLKKLDKKPGLIIQKGYSSATFLPSVWEQLPDKEEFLSHLCMKAGLPPSEWKSPEMTFLSYESEEFSDE